MLKSLDVLIGISLVMLIVSMVVTILTQFITTAINSHGRNLKKGLEDLIAHLDPALREKAVSALVVEAVLTHPLIGTKPILPFSGLKMRLGSIIHRDELTRILLELASPDAWVKIGNDAERALQQALKNSGIDDVDATLDNIRNAAMALEQSNPELASSVRADMAILQQAKSKFVGRINGWFDQTIDRVSQRFTMSARAITFGCALVIAFAIQLDTVGLINALWTNDAARQQLASEANAAMEKLNPGAPSSDSLKQLQEIRDLAMRGLINLPWQTQAATSQLGSGAWSQWLNRLTPDKFLGILLSAFLLSLGAPFWYNSLGTLLKMRPEIAGKDDAQRRARQSQGAVGPAP